MKALKVILLIFIVFNACYIAKISAAELFKIPSEGYIGWRYLQDTNGQEGTHNGIDIWSTPGGGWNNGINGNSNPVYAAYSGQTIYTEDINWHGFIVKHNDNLYSNYWHVRNWQVALWNNVDQNTIMGYQDMANTVHLHFTISATSSGSGHVDPSPYLGMQLNVNNPNVVAWGTQVTRNGCNSADVLISNQNITGNSTCSARNSITIMPETIISGDHRFYIQ